VKNREFDKEAAQILESGASDIVREQGASEDPKFVAKPTPSKTDSSSCFGINADDRPIIILAPREGKFDSALVEAGPPALLTDEGILLFYNGKNSAIHGDPKIFPKAYSAGQVLLDANDPTRVISRSESCFLTPERPYEMKGQYQGGTVFIQGLVHFHDKWFLYYGTADAAIGVAIDEE